MMDKIFRTLFGMDEKILPKERYARVDIDLGASENIGADVLKNITGYSLSKIKYTGAAEKCYFRFDSIHGAKIYPSEFQSRYTPSQRFEKIYLTNETAQPGKHLIFIIGAAITPDIEADRIQYISRIRDVTIVKDDVTITANGIVAFSAVPVGKVWNIHSYSLGAYAGTYKHSTVGIYDPATSLYLPLETYTATAAIRSAIFEHTIPMTAGMRLYVYIEDYSVEGLLWFRYLYDEEESK